MIRSQVNGTILLIEVDPVNLVALSLILHSFGHTVLEADSQDEAVRVCHHHRGPIHLVVTTAFLQRKDAKQGSRRSELLNWPTRALFLSDEPPKELPDATYEHTFLRTPFRAEALASIISELLHSPQSTTASSA
jgi:CheY-like chemotaxis protein